MSEEQIILIGLIASLLTFGLKILATYANYKPSRVVINIMLYVVFGFLFRDLNCLMSLVFTLDCVI